LFRAHASETLYIEPNDPHFNPAGNALAGNAIYERLKELLR